jgi:hypothetical protein
MDKKTTKNGVQEKDRILNMTREEHGQGSKNIAWDSRELD